MAFSQLSHQVGGKRKYETVTLIHFLPQIKMRRPPKRPPNEPSYRYNVDVNVKPGSEPVTEATNDRHI